ncbi:hypothetical protein [Blautia sp.]|uniref:hypothetical protein n=1 Tax=Blautia sp. TaxID=1955243 RepID=UPI003AB3502A
MRKTTQFSTSSENLTVDTPRLMEMLEVGRATAVQIGTEAEARIQIGRRVLWNIKKIKKFLDEISE